MKVALTILALLVIAAGASLPFWYFKEDVIPARGDLEFTVPSPDTVEEALADFDEDERVLAETLMREPESFQAVVVEQNPQGGLAVAPSWGDVASPSLEREQGVPQGEVDRDRESALRLQQSSAYWNDYISDFRSVADPEVRDPDAASNQAAIEAIAERRNRRL